MAARKASRTRTSKSASKRRASSPRRKTAAKKKAPRRTAARKPVRRKSAPKSARRKPAKRKVAPRTRKSAGARRTTATRKKARTSAPERARTPRAAAPAVPSAIGFQIQHMDYTSHAMEEVQRFYTELLGFSKFEAQGEGDYLVVQTGPSSSLGFMPPIPGPPERWRPPREPAIYLIVKDVDRVYRDLTAKGVQFEQAPENTHWGHRLAVTRDPEGRTVYLAHVIKGK